MFRDSNIPRQGNLMAKTSLEVDPATGIARLMLSSPKDRNVLSWDMLEELRNRLEAVAHDASIRALVLTAGDTDFCLGGDLRDLHRVGCMTAAEARCFMGPRTLMLESVMTMLFSLPIPTIAAVSGQAAGAGIALALATDFRVMGRSSKFNLAYASLGLPSDGGVAWLLSRQVGEAGALKLLLTQPVIRAQQAFTLGLADQVVSSGMELGAANDLAIDLSALPLASSSSAVLLLRLSLLDQFRTQMSSEHGYFMNAIGRTETRRSLAKMRAD